MTKEDQELLETHSQAMQFLANYASSVAVIGLTFILIIIEIGRIFNMSKILMLIGATVWGILVLSHIQDMRATRQFYYEIYDDKLDIHFDKLKED